MSHCWQAVLYYPLRPLRRVFVSQAALVVCGLAYLLLSG